MSPAAPSLFRPARSLLSSAVCLSFLATALTGCGSGEPEQFVPPPPAVSVIEVRTQEIAQHREFVARTEAFKSVELRARVEGEITHRSFVEGEYVEEGKLLFEIDRDTYEAAFNKAKADLASAKASNEKAQRDLARGEELRPNGFISQSDLDTLTSNALTASANVEASTAALDTAKVNLDFTRITAPFAGEVSKVNYNVGNLVGPTSNPLTTLIQVNPIYVNFQLDEGEYINYLQQNPDRAAAEAPVKLSIRLPNGEIYKEPGRINYAATEVDATTGTVNIRADFDNPQKIVRPGLYVTLMVESTKTEQLPLIPQYAVQQNQQGNFVLVVNEDNNTEMRIVDMGRRIGPMWVVNGGLKDGDVIIVEGLQKVRAGSEVNPQHREIDLTTGVLSGGEQGQSKAPQQRSTEQ